MRLDRLQINGFKSFGDLTELAFHGGVTAIVGPNGCGKSNISDAIGWVLGEQSVKSLRGQKMEDVIFNGCETRAPLGLAQVTLKVSQLNQLNGGGSGEAREVEVTRRLDRSGESEYLIDGAICRLRDVHELFMDTGVGTKAYSIIEQGKIGLILSSKPADRRSLIEEAAGITKYKARRRSAEVKLEAAQQNLLRVNDIIYEVERQMNSLKRQAAKARRYRRLRDAATHIEKILSVGRAREIETELGSLRQKLRAVGDEELRRSTSLTTAETYLEGMRLSLAEHEGDAARVREQMHARELAAERLDQRIGNDRQQATDIEARQAQLRADLGSLGERHGPAARELAARREEEVTLGQEFARAEESAAATQKELSRAALAEAEVEQEIESARAELVHRISKMAALRNFLQGVLVNAEKVAAEIVKLREEVRELDSEKGRLLEERAQLEAEMSESRARAEVLSAELKRAEEDAASLRHDLAETEQEIATRREELSGLVGRLASLEELVQARVLLGAGARELLTTGAAAGLRLNGIAADFIEVEPRFERAAEHFYADALQRVLLDSAEDALAARLHVERANVGRCDFLIEALAAEGAPQEARLAAASLRERDARGVVGVLSEALRFANGKAEVISRSLADAVVMERVEDALEAFRLEPGVAYVTLAGEVVGPPGVLQAGPGGPSEGLLRTRREIRELREAADRRNRLVEGLEARQRQLAAERDAAESRKAALREEQHALEKTRVGLDHRLGQLEESESRLGRKAEVLSSEQGRSESERGSLAAQRTEMEEALALEEKTKADLESHLQQALGLVTEKRQAVERLTSQAAEQASRVAALRERVQAARIDRERLEEGVRELSARIRSGEEDQRRMEARQTELERDLAAAERELATALGERDRLREELSQVEALSGSLRRRIEEAEAAIKLRRKELEAVRERRAGEEVSLAREGSQLEHLAESFHQTHGLSWQEAAGALASSDLSRGRDSLEAELSEIRGKIDSLGPVNLVAIEQFQELETRFEFLSRQRKDLLDSIASTGQAIERIDATSRQRFAEAFREVNRHFDATFKQLFGGGRAGLSLIDEQDVLESGIDISAQPPGKRLQNVLLLSGGEKALTAIALMFAIFRYKPSPFCLLDEVDAPLDDANLGRFLGMLSALTDSTQFIIITHNRKTMEMADHMYGVTMEEPGISKLVSVKLVEAAELAAAH